MDNDNDTIPITAPADTAPSVSPVASPAVEPGLAAPADPAADAPFLHTDTPTLLSVDPTAEAADPAATDPMAAVDAAPVDASQAVPSDSETPAAVPLVYEFKLPEGVQVDETKLDAAKAMFQEHGVDPAVAQAMVDFHAAEMQRHNDAVADQQQHAFAELRRGWADQVRSDPELGGAGFNTSMQRIFRVRDMFVPERDQAAFNDFLNATGAGDNPAFLRFVYRVSQKFDEGAPAPQPMPIQPSKKELNRRTMYDHPRSVAAAERNR